MAKGKNKGGQAQQPQAQAAAAAAAAPAAAPARAASAPAVDNTPWQEVKNAKKEKYEVGGAGRPLGAARCTRSLRAAQARLKRKQEQAVKEKVASAPVGAPAAAAPKAAAPAKKKEKENKNVAVPSSTSHVAKMKKKKGGKTGKPSKQAAQKPKSEAELVAALVNILQSAPTQFLQQSAIGDRLQVRVRRRSVGVAACDPTWGVVLHGRP